MEIRPYRANDESEVVALWQACGLVVPWNNPTRDIERKLKVNPELFLVGILMDRIIASIMGGYEGHRGWINYLAVHPDFQRQGHGREMMAVVEGELRACGCPKINLQVREGNSDAIRFYERLGYSVDPVISMGKRLIPDL